MKQIILTTLFIVLLSIACGDNGSDDSVTDTGNTGDSGNTTDTGNSGNSGDTGNTGSTEGTKQWTRQRGTAEHDSGYSLAVDSSDNIYVMGTTNGRLGSNTYPAGDLFLTKYSTEGTQRWTRQWGIDGGNALSSVVVDSNDNIYMIGVPTGRDITDNTNEENPGDLLRKYNADGIKQWDVVTGKGGDALAVDSNDNIYLTGVVLNASDNCYLPPCYDIFLTKYSADGTQQWNEQWGTPYDDEGYKVAIGGYSVAVDSNDAIYVTGYVHGFTNALSRDLFLTKYTADGIQQWTKQWGTSSSEKSFSVAVDSNDNIYVTGYTHGDFDGNTNAGFSDIFLTKYNSDGTQQWTEQWGSSSYDEGYSVTVDSNDNIYVTGYTFGSLDGTSASEMDNIFLTKYGADGTQQWNKQWGASEFDQGTSVAVDSNDNIYVTGKTEGDLDGNTNAGGYGDIFLTKWSF